MGTRGLGAPEAPVLIGQEPEAPPLEKEEAEVPVLPGATDSWRTWLLTGVRRAPIDRHRIHGAHRGLKEMLVEGTHKGGDRQQPWKEFSSAIVRQAVDEAMNALPAEQKQVVKLAYFAGLTNREIAQRLGLTVGGVRRRLREALNTVGNYIERGWTYGRRAVFGLVVWLSGRRLGDHSRRQWGSAPDQLLQAVVVVAASAAVAAVLVTHPASPAQLTKVDQGPGAGVVQQAPNVLEVPKTPVQAVTGTLPVPSRVTVEVPPLPGAPSLPITVPVPAGLAISVPTPVPSVPAPPKLLP